MTMVTLSASLHNPSHPDLVLFALCIKFLLDQNNRNTSQLTCFLSNFYTIIVIVHSFKKKRI